MMNNISYYTVVEKTGREDVNSIVTKIMGNNDDGSK